MSFSRFLVVLTLFGKQVNFIPGSADSTCKILYVRTLVVKQISAPDNPVRTCCFFYSGNMIMYSNDSTLKKSCYNFFRDLSMPGKLSLIQKRI